MSPSMTGHIPTSELTYDHIPSPSPNPNPNITLDDVDELVDRTVLAEEDLARVRVRARIRARVRVRIRARAEVRVRVRTKD